MHFNCILDSVANLLVRHMVFVGNVQKSPIASHLKGLKSKKISNDQELIQSDPISCPQNQKGIN